MWTTIVVHLETNVWLMIIFIRIFTCKDEKDQVSSVHMHNAQGNFLAEQM